MPWHCIPVRTIPARFFGIIRPWTMHPSWTMCPFDDASLDDVYRTNVSRPWTTYRWWIITICSNSSFAHANSTHRLPLQSWPNLSHYNVSNPSEFVTCLLSRIFLCLPPLTITARQVVLFHCYCLLLNFDLGKRLRSWEKNIPVNMNVNNWINIGINLSWALVVLRGKYENIIVYTMYRNFPLVWR